MAHGGTRLEILANAVASRVVRLILETIDLDSIVGSIDIDALVGRVDVEEIVERVDIDAIVQRIDIQAIADRLDINKIANEIDIDALLKQTELGSVIARSTGSILTEILDLIRSQAVGLDDFVARWIRRLMRRQNAETPLGPADLVASNGTGPDGHSDSVGVTRSVPRIGDLSEVTDSRQGQYAGAVSRLAAFAADIGITWLLYSLAIAALTWTVHLFTGHTLSTPHSWLVGTTYAIWALIYFSYQWGLGGKTVGMAILGIRVVRQEGKPASVRQAILRTVSFPLAILTLGLGFLGILFGRERRALYDRIAGTAVVYDWDARAAHLRWLARKSA